MANVLYDFQILVDTDFGVFKYIKTNPKLRKPSFFDEKIMTKSNEDVLRLLIARKTLNPLDAFAVKDKVGKLDSIYYEIMSNPEIYDTVLKLSIPTAFYKVFRLGNNVPNNAHNGKIMYYNDTELKFITNVLKLPESVCVPFESQMSLKDYGTILINIYKDILKFDIDSIEGKTIFIPDNAFNLSQASVFGAFSENAPNASVTRIINKQITNVQLKNIVEIRNKHVFDKLEVF